MDFLLKIKKSAARMAVMTVIMMSVLAGSVSGQAATPKEKEGVLEITGRVRESLAKKDLLKASVKLIDSTGTVIDSTKTGGYYYGDASGNIYERARFSFKVPRRDAVYTLEVGVADYDTLYQSLTIDKIGGREHARLIPDLIMHKTARKLGEVTVRASRVKFYSRGDTLVFNADAFELAEGSMLDALIKQLPGVELREGGQIYVNGEYVEDLLLNGKDFFKGNNELMLDNLGAYTVKDIEVYKRTSDSDKWAGVKGQEKLAMDVKLKKEYNAGWLMNYEAGLGTSERYMGRAFLNRFTNNSRITLVGNINNLNDNRKPGESTTWTPQSNTTGTMRTQMAALDYNVQNQEGTEKANGSAMVRHTSQNDVRNVIQKNFLLTNPMYDYTFNNSHAHNLNMNTSHQASKEKDGSYYMSASVSGTYQHNRNDGSYRGAMFNREQDEMTSGMIDTLYSGDPTALAALVNRTTTRTLNSGHSASVNGSLSGMKMIPKTNDYVTAGIRAFYSTSKSEVWRDYVINYGADPVAAVKQNQYFDNSPNRNTILTGSIGYRYAIDKDMRLGLTYYMNHNDERKDSYMYALDRLADMGVIGTLPEGYLSAFDAGGSYRSHLVENKHTIDMSLYRWREKLYLQFEPKLSIINRNFAYFRGEKNHDVHQRYTTFVVGNWDCQIGWSINNVKFNNRDMTRNRIDFRPTIETSLPDPVKMIDVTDSNDPQNIWLGNPGLKPSVKYGSELKWMYQLPVRGRIFRNELALIYGNTHNALVNGYTIDRSTGVRVNKTYNVASGNYVAKIHVSPAFQFGSRGQFSMFYRGGLDYIHSADMIGENAIAPQLSNVETWWQAHTVNFSWDLGKKQSVGFMGQINSRHTTSDRESFDPITATHTNLTVRGNFALPKGFGVSTDFTVYMRHGYGSKELDTTEAVWNARLTYTPPKSKWVIMLDGFDMLHNLSNVMYAVTAQGQTVTYTNVLPRYIMLHVQYRINIQPKKKIIDTRLDWGNLR